MAEAMQEDIQLRKFFTSYDSCRDELKKLESACHDNSSVLDLARHGLICIEREVESGQVYIANGVDVEENESRLREQHLNIEDLLSASTGSQADPSVFVLALQGLWDIGQFDSQPHLQTIKQLLRKWRCESPLSSYEGAYHWDRTYNILKSLTIFKEFDVPLFIDSYGNKKVLSNYHLSNYQGIDENTPIYHVTHRAEADKIFEEKRLKPSDNKNMIKGTWFGIDGPDMPSIFGSRSFETTLGKLGVQVLRQGEIVSYKHEVNVILYAGISDGQWDGTLDATGLKKPKVTDPKYVMISIFVPSEFLPSEDDFSTVFEGPFEVAHGPFCVKVKREKFGHEECPELNY